MTTIAQSNAVLTEDMVDLLTEVHCAAFRLSDAFLDAQRQADKDGNAAAAAAYEQAGLIIYRINEGCNLAIDATSVTDAIEMLLQGVYANAGKYVDAAEVTRRRNHAAALAAKVAGATECQGEG